MRVCVLLHFYLLFYFSKWFSFLNHTQNCSKGWDSYCFTENNIDSDECLQ